MKHSVVKQQGVASIFFVLSLSAILAVNFFAFQSLVRINKQVRLGDASEAAALALTEISDFQLAQVVGVVDIPYPDQGQAETYAAAYVREYMGTTGTATTVSNINVVRSLPNRKHISYTVTPTVTDTEIFPDMWSIQNDSQEISNQGKAAKGFQGPINVAFVTDFSASMRGYPLLTLKAVTAELIAYLEATNKGSKIGLYPFNTAFHTTPISREFMIPLVTDIQLAAQTFITTFGMTPPLFFEGCLAQPPGMGIPAGQLPCPEPLSVIAKKVAPVFARYAVTPFDVMQYRFPIQAQIPELATGLLAVELPTIVDGLPVPNPLGSPSLVQSRLPIGPLAVNPLWLVDPGWPIFANFFFIPLVDNFPMFSAPFALMTAGGFTSVSQGMIPAAKGLVATKRKDLILGKRQKYVMIVMSDGNENYGFEAFTRLVGSGFCQMLKTMMLGPDDDPRDFQMAYIGIPTVSPATIFQYEACFGPENVYWAAEATQVRDRILTIMSKATDTKLYYRFGQVYGE
ncbi:hypothetical protein [Vibrio hepatarius]|uniref:hypothetical protein n=1 Tax=Vibrio hepatarius TaxID=171383 RepID=UPI001C08A057|nr:hypothetical protein [Vibrio hepatarius]MBU2896214.1 hypothetical protein [Vibrio hepatarius]